MISALITFLGGVTFRLFIGHLFDFVNKWQDQKNEIARLEVQGKLAAEQHSRNLESMRAQAEAGVKLIETQADANVTMLEAEAVLQAVKATSTQTGIKFVDVWNGLIRPLLASVCIALWMVSLQSRDFKLDDWDRALMSMALGIFVGGRIQSTGR